MASSSDFVGSAVGESQKKTNAMLEKARGKLLVIDEAYNLDDKLYGKQVRSRVCFVVWAVLYILLRTIFIFLIPNCSLFAMVQKCNCCRLLFKSTYQMLDNHKILKQLSSRLLIKIYSSDLNQNLIQNFWSIEMAREGFIYEEIRH